MHIQWWSQKFKLKTNIRYINCNTSKNGNLLRVTRLSYTLKRKDKGMLVSHIQWYRGRGRWGAQKVWVNEQDLHFFCPKADGFLSPNERGSKAKHKRETIRPSLLLETPQMRRQTELGHIKYVQYKNTSYAIHTVGNVLHSFNTLFS